MRITRICKGTAATDTPRASACKRHAWRPAAAWHVEGHDWIHRRLNHTRYICTAVMLSSLLYRAKHRQGSQAGNARHRRGRPVTWFRTAGMGCGIPCRIAGGRLVRGILGCGVVLVVGALQLLRVGTWSSLLRSPL